MSYKIQYKVTVWNEIELDEKYSEDKIIQLLKDCPSLSPWELFEDPATTTLYETEELITVEENDGQETIEVYEDDKIIWTNAEAQ